MSIREQITKMLGEDVAVVYMPPSFQESAQGIHGKYVAVDLPPVSGPLANSIKAEQIRKTKKRLGRPPKKHGTARRFYEGCRCPDCVSAHSKDLKRRRDKRAAAKEV